MTDTVALPDAATTWVLIERAPDLDGVWSVHLLNFDIVTQGLTIEDAMDMGRDAASVYISAVIKTDSDVIQLANLSHLAPDEYWTRLWKVVSEGVRLTGGMIIHDDYVSKFAAYMRISVKDDPGECDYMPTVFVSLKNQIINSSQ